MFYSDQDFVTFWDCFSLVVFTNFAKKASSENIKKMITFLSITKDSKCALKNLTTNTFPLFEQLFTHFFKSPPQSDKVLTNLISRILFANVFFYKCSKLSTSQSFIWRGLDFVFTIWKQHFKNITFFKFRNMS